MLNGSPDTLSLNRTYVYVYETIRKKSEEDLEAFSNLEIIQKQMDAGIVFHFIEKTMIVH